MVIGGKIWPVNKNLPPRSDIYRCEGGSRDKAGMAQTEEFGREEVKARALEIKNATK